MEEYAITAGAGAGADDFTEVLVGAAATSNNGLKSATTTATSVLLLLHVEPTNHVALNFYRKLEYQDHFHHAVSNRLLNVEQLTENTGTKGQLLLGKLLDAVAEPTIAFHLKQ